MDKVQLEGYTEKTSTPAPKCNEQIVLWSWVEEFYDEDKVFLVSREPDSAIILTWEKKERNERK